MSSVDSEMDKRKNLAPHVNAMELFRGQEAVKLAKEYLNAFDGIRIFGTAEEPVFMASDVARVLGKNLHYKDQDSTYRDIVHIVSIYVDTGYGIKSVKAFTEMGLMKAVCHSNADIAIRFQEFIKAAVKQLRLRGFATATTVLQELKEAREALQRKIEECEVLGISCDMYHEKWKKEEQRAVAYSHINSALVHKAEVDKTIIQNLHDRSDKSGYELEQRLQRMYRRYYRPVYVHVVRNIPGFIGDMSYDDEDYYRNASNITWDDIQHDSYDCFGDTQSLYMQLSFTRQVGKDIKPITELYVEKKLTLTEIYEYLREGYFTDAKGPIEHEHCEYILRDKHGQHVYPEIINASLDNVWQAIDSLNKKTECEREAARIRKKARIVDESKKQTVVKKSAKGRKPKSQSDDEKKPATKSRKLKPQGDDNEKKTAPRGRKPKSQDDEKKTVLKTKPKVEVSSDETTDSSSESDFENDGKAVINPELRKKLKPSNDELEDFMDSNFTADEEVNYLD